MRNDPVDLETAKKLKEKGFNRKCKYYWFNTELMKGDKFNYNSSVETIYSAPTAYEAIDFLLDIALSKV